MSGQGFDPGAIGDLLSSLSQDDMAALQDMAASLFSGTSKEESADAPAQAAAGSAGRFGGLDLESLAKIASVMELLQSEQKDPRTELLAALRPLLGEARRPKVDQAVHMLHLLSLLPKIRELGLF